MIRRNKYIGEVDVGCELYVIAHLEIRGGNLDAGIMHVCQQHAERIARAAQHDNQVAHRRIGNPALLAIDAIAAIDLGRHGFDRFHRKIRAGFGFAGGKAAHELPANQLGQVFFSNIGLRVLQGPSDQNGLTVVHR